MDLKLESGFLLFKEDEPRYIVSLWLIASALVQAIFVRELAITLSTKDASLGSIGILAVCNLVPLVVFFVSLLNVRTRPCLKIFEDHVVVTNFGKTTVVLVEDIKFLRRRGAYFDIVQHSGDSCLSPALQGARYARELLEDLIGWELSDREFVERRKSVIAWIIVVGMVLPFLLFLLFKVLG